jgi:DNA helicase HerA-like ATPase
VTQRLYVLPPGSQIGPITPEQRQALLQGSLVAGVYDKTVDRESAYEKLKGRADSSATAGDSLREQASRATTDGARDAATQAADEATGGLGGALMGGLGDLLFGTTGLRGGRRDGLVQTMAKSAVRSVGSSVGREIVRGVLGSLLGGGGSRRR